MDRDLLSSLKLHPGFAALKEILSNEYSLYEGRLRVKPGSTDMVDFIFQQGEFRGGLDVLDHLFEELEIEREPR